MGVSPIAVTFQTSGHFPLNHDFGRKSDILAGGLKHFLFSPLPGKMIQFDSYFSNGLKPPTSIELSCLMIM